MVGESVTMDRNTQCRELKDEDLICVRLLMADLRFILYHT